MSLLRIPRKQNFTGGAIASSFAPSTDTAAGGSADRVHLEKALSENFLSIERWANQQSVSVCMAQTGTHTYSYPYLSSTPGPWEVFWDQYDLADPSDSRIRIPEPGIYTGFAAATATVIAACTQAEIGHITLAVGGGTSFMTPSFFSNTYSGVSFQIVLSSGSIDHKGIADIVASFPFMATTAGWLVPGFDSNSTEIQGRITAFGMLREGEIPSKNQ